MDILRDPIWQFFGVVVGIVAILTSIGISRRRRKDQMTASSTEGKVHLVKALPLLTEEALESRRSHAKFYQEYARRQDNTAVREKLRPIIEEGRVAEPTVQLPDSYFVDCICSVVTKEGKAIAIFPSGDSKPDVEGVGRTSLLLRLIGITIPYGRLLGLDESRSLPDKLTVFRRPDSWCRLIASDIAYIGCSEGRLSVIPTQGEMISFVWDLARHIFRSTTLDYRTGDHRRGGGRERLYDIFYRIPFQDLVNVFGRLDALYPIDEIIILRRSISNPRSPTRVILTGKEREEQLRKAMLVGYKHGSAFWKRNPETLEHIVDSILQQVNWSRVCPVVELTISHPNQITPNYVFGEAAELIRTGRLANQQDGTVSLKTGIGIRYHNDQLIRSLRDVDEIRILATSGEHLFKDVAFWKELSQVHRQFTLKLLLLDPESHVVDEREKQAYSDKGSAFLHEEIAENIATIRRMCDFFKKSGNEVHIECRLYHETPSFRMTIIGVQRLLVSSYEVGKRTGSDTVFYDVQADQEGSLFWGFKAEYDRIESHLDPIAL